MVRTTCIYSGQVQGVGFRYTVMNVAQSYDVTGYVRNLPDGRVELVMEGPADQRMDMLEDIRSRMEDYIEDTSMSESPAVGEFQTFSVRH